MGLCWTDLCLRFIRVSLQLAISVVHVSIGREQAMSLAVVLPRVRLRVVGLVHVLTTLGSCGLSSSGVEENR